MPRTTRRASLAMRRPQRYASLNREHSPSLTPPFVIESYQIVVSVTCHLERGSQADQGYASMHQPHENDGNAGDVEGEAHAATVKRREHEFELLAERHEPESVQRLGRSAARGRRSAATDARGRCNGGLDGPRVIQCSC